MPTFQGQLTEEQLSQLIAYVRSLGGTGSAEAGGTAPASGPGIPPAARWRAHATDSGWIRRIRGRTDRTDLTRTESKSWKPPQ